MAVQIEAAERNDRGLELMVGEGYRIKIGAGFCAATLRRLLERSPLSCVMSRRIAGADQAF
jgi:hypothetical protein